MLNDNLTNNGCSNTSQLDDKVKRLEDIIDGYDQRFNTQDLHTQKLTANNGNIANLESAGVKSDSVDAGALTADSVAVTGSIKAKSFTVEDPVLVNGVTSPTANIGTVDATDVNAVNGKITNLTVENLMTAPDSSLEYKNISVTNRATINKLNLVDPHVAEVIADNAKAVDLEVQNIKQLNDGKIIRGDTNANVISYVNGATILGDLENDINIAGRSRPKWNDLSLATLADIQIGGVKPVYRGEVENFSQLPPTGNAKGDLYVVRKLVIADKMGIGHAQWNGEAWDPTLIYELELFETAEDFEEAVRALTTLIEDNAKAIEDEMKDAVNRETAIVDGIAGSRVKKVENKAVMAKPTGDEILATKNDLPKKDWGKSFAQVGLEVKDYDPKSFLIGLYNKGYRTGDMINFVWMFAACGAITADNGVKTGNMAGGALIITSLEDGENGPYPQNMSALFISGWGEEYIIKINKDLAYNKLERVAITDRVWALAHESIKTVVDSDLNNLNEPGTYWCKVDGTYTHKPEGFNGFELLVFEVAEGIKTIRKQVALSHSNNRVALRYFNNSSWSEWQEVAPKDEAYMLTGPTLYIKEGTSLNNIKKAGQYYVNTADEALKIKDRPPKASATSFNMTVEYLYGDPNYPKQTYFDTGNQVYFYRFGTASGWPVEWKEAATTRSTVADCEALHGMKYYSDVSQFTTWTPVFKEDNTKRLCEELPDNSTFEGFYSNTEVVSRFGIPVGLGDVVNVKVTKQGGESWVFIKTNTGNQATRFYNVHSPDPAWKIEICPGSEPIYITTTLKRDRDWAGFMREAENPDPEVRKYSIFDESERIIVRDNCKKRPVIFQVPEVISDRGNRIGIIKVLVLNTSESTGGAGTVTEDTILLGWEWTKDRG